MAAIASFQLLLSRGQVQEHTILLDTCLTGLAHPVDGGWVISQRLLQTRQTVGSDAELIAAILATQDTYREAWSRILAARCQEAGQWQDAQVLLQLVTRLGNAAHWVEQALPTASLAPTTHTHEERELFGCSAEQNTATPLLLRVLATAVQLSHWQNQPLPTLGKVDTRGHALRQNWYAGRLLVLPGNERLAGNHDNDYLLQAQTPVNSHKPTSFDWLLSQPWALLLTMITYAQYTWAAESRGGLLLELPNGQNAYQPAGVQVLVQGVQGDEVHCGSLAGLVLRVLEYVSMACFPQQPTVAELDQALSPLVGELLKRHIWHYREGGSGAQGQYQLHPTFADACFTIEGVKVFKLEGLALWQAVRIQAEQWRQGLLKR